MVDQLHVETLHWPDNPIISSGQETGGTILQEFVWRLQNGHRKDFLGIPWNIEEERNHLLEIVGKQYLTG